MLLLLLLPPVAAVFKKFSSTPAILQQLPALLVLAFAWFKGVGALSMWCVCGGVSRAPSLDPPSPQKGSINRAPKTNPGTCVVSMEGQAGGDREVTEGGGASQGAGG